MIPTSAAILLLSAVALFVCRSRAEKLRSAAEKCGNRKNEIEALRGMKVTCAMCGNVYRSVRASARGDSHVLMRHP